MWSQRFSQSWLAPQQQPYVSAKLSQIGVSTPSTPRGHQKDGERMSETINATTTDNGRTQRAIAAMQLLQAACLWGRSKAALAGECRDAESLLQQMKMVREPSCRLHVTPGPPVVYKSVGSPCRLRRLSSCPGHRVV